MYQKPGDQEHAVEHVVARTQADIPTSPCTVLPVCFSQNGSKPSAFLRQIVLDFSPKNLLEKIV